VKAVPGAGFEPARREAEGFKPSASAIPPPGRYIEIPYGVESKTHEVGYRYVIGVAEAPASATRA
jgi:hypothetical protein